MLRALGFAAIAYLTAQALSGPMLVAAWAVEALALLGLGVSTRSQQARYAGAAFMTFSLGHALILEPPPAALVTGAPDLAATAKALGAIAFALLVRVISFIALGLLLLAGAFAYQRLRPPPLPDMREVHRASDEKGPRVSSRRA